MRPRSSTGLPGTREATPGPESETREVKQNFSFVATNYFYFFLKVVAIRSKLLFISGAKLHINEDTAV